MTRRPSSVDGPPAESGCVSGSANPATRRLNDGELRVEGRRASAIVDAMAFSRDTGLPKLFLSTLTSHDEPRRRRERFPPIVLVALALCLLACGPKERTWKDEKGPGPAAGSSAAHDSGNLPATPSSIRSTVLVIEPDAPPGTDLDTVGREAPAGGAPRSSRLQEVIERADGPLTIELPAGYYVLSPSRYEDPSCGNCEDPKTPAHATRGLRVHGHGIHIRSSEPEGAVIVTRAGYGILFDGCEDCSLEGVTVTGGARDGDGKATDAAVVVLESTVRVAGCRIADNIGDPETVRRTVVGIIGITGREGSDIHIEGCTIERNSWDGIALYRGARASIQDNVVDGIDSAAGATVGGGRGVGIGLTWDARATITGNLVRHYWKGIGVFVDARADVRENVVEDILTWGISLWDAGKGKPAAEFRRNVIYRTGACGAMIARSEGGDPTSGVLMENILVMTGQNPKYDSGEPYCRQQALADEAVPAGFLVSGNVFSENREPGSKPGSRDVDHATFVEKARGLLPRPPNRALSRSRFAADFPELFSAAGP